MSLDSGTTLGSYQVTAKIGQGGMGEVYRARDTKLDRDVALKVLPQAFTDDPDRLARFEREAKVLASMNHPNIGGIHGLEELEGVRALVLEYIDGPTLADRIAQGPIPVDEALPIAKQIAEATRSRSRSGRYSSRSETRQHQAEAGRRGQSARLWFGEGARHCARRRSISVSDADRCRHPDGRDHGDRGVYVAGASTGQARGQAGGHLGGHLGVRLCAL